MVETTTYYTPKNILIANDSFLVSLGVKVTNTGVTADANGKKILKAGTPIAGNIEKRDTAFIRANDATATGVLLHDVDVTAGANNGTIILAGCVDLLKLEDATKTFITTTVKTALPRIIFVEGSAI